MPSHARPSIAARRPPGGYALSLFLLLPLLAAVAGRPSGLAMAEASPAAIYLPILSPQPPRVEALRFSHERGFYEAPISLRIETASPGALIRYTTDGSAPSETQGAIYVGPITLDRTTVLRAMGLRPGHLPTAIETRSFVFPAEVVRQAEPDPRRFPAAWGYYPDGGAWAGQPVPADYGMDPEIVASPEGARLAQDLLAIPSISLSTAPDDLFAAPGLFGKGRGIYAHPLEEGSDWERPASVELLRADGQPGFQIDCGVRIAGQWSRKPDSTAKHSFSLRFRSRYGPSRLEYPLFPGSPVDSFDTLRLRAGQADSFHFFPLKAQYIHDQWGRDSQRAMGWLSARGSFVHLYLNGHYWGLYNLSEEPTAAFAADHLGGEEESFDVVKGLERSGTDASGNPITIQTYEVEDGDARAFEAMLAIKDRGPASDPARLAEMARTLDIPQHIDFTLLEIFGANADWLGKNWRAVRRREPGAGFAFLVWDIEQMTQLRDLDARCGSPAAPNCGNIADTPGVMGLHAWLKGSPAYRMAFADRVRRQLFEGGALTPEANRARYRGLAQQIDRAIVGESARWGDVEPRPRTLNEQADFWALFWHINGRGAPQRRDPHWLHERDRVLDDVFPTRTAIVLQQLCDAGLYPPLAFPQLRVEPQAGDARVSRVLLEPYSVAPRCAGTRSVGTIYYTLDGSDPRDPASGDPAQPWSGRPGPSAQVYAGPVVVTGYRPLKARLALAEGGRLVWSALSEAQVGAPALAFSELHYHPEDEDHEFIELRNLEAQAVDLSGASLSDGVRHVFPEGSQIAPQGHLVLVRDPEAFGARYPGVAVDGVFDGRLANEGEPLTLRDAAGTLLARVHYDDGGFWPIAPDGFGYSLVMVDAAGRPEDPENWRASAAPGGSPGAPDPPPAQGRVLVNELLANAAPPFEPAVELVNPGPAPVDVGGWLLSDDRDALGKFRIPPGTVLAPGGFAAFYAPALESGGAPMPDAAPEARDAPPAHGLGRGFLPDPAGGSVYLASADAAGRLTGLILGVDFGPAARNVSVGRHHTAAGLELAPQAAPSFGVAEPVDPADFRRGRGAANGPPRVGPVVIAEILYRPDSVEDAFVELANRSDRPVPLYDVTGPDRVWTLGGAIDFAFPYPSQIPAGGRMLVVRVDPGAFRARHPEIPRDVAVLGPFTGSLDAPGEALRLLRPPWPELGEVGPIEEDRVAYGSAAPWPQAAAQQGLSLEREPLAGHGNDPASWRAWSQGGTPGLAPRARSLLRLPLLVVGN